MNATHAHATRPTHYLIPLLLLVTALCTLAGRPAQAQTLWLPYDNTTLNIHYTDGTTDTGPLTVNNQDFAGHFTGTLTLSRSVYAVQGTLTFWAWVYTYASDMAYPAYTLSFNATSFQHIKGRVISTTTLHYDGWLKTGPGFQFSIASESLYWLRASGFSGILTIGLCTIDGSGKIVTD